MFILYLNKAAGIEVNPVQPPKVPLKASTLTAVLYLNNAAGIEVSEGQSPKQDLNAFSVIFGHFLNKFALMLFKFLQCTNAQ